MNLQEEFEKDYLSTVGSDAKYLGKINNTTEYADMVTHSLFLMYQAGFKKGAEPLTGAN